MKKYSTLFLQLVLVLIGIAALIFMLWEPHLEGRNVNATLFEIYFTDPFLAYVYIMSIPFFIAIYQGIKVLGYIRENKIFSEVAAKSLRTIKYCAFFTAGAVVLADIFLMIGARSTGEDAAGAFMLSFIAIAASITVGVAVGVFERIVWKE